MFSFLIWWLAFCRESLRLPEYYLVTRGHRPERHFAENPSGTGKLSGTSGHRPKVARAFVLFGSSLSVCCLFGFLVVVCLLVGLFACSVFGCLSVWLFVGVFFFLLLFVGFLFCRLSVRLVWFLPLLFVGLSVCLFVWWSVVCLVVCLAGWRFVCSVGRLFVRLFLLFVCLLVCLVVLLLACCLVGCLFGWWSFRLVGLLVVRSFVCLFVRLFFFFGFWVAFAWVW
jgi:hypothetical protein